MPEGGGLAKAAGRGKLLLLLLGVWQEVQQQQKVGLMRRHRMQVWGELGVGDCGEMNQLALPLLIRQVGTRRQGRKMSMKMTVKLDVHCWKRRMKCRRRKKKGG
jgi:hypothetical protein